jgi:monoamine oxidase
MDTSAGAVVVGAGFAGLSAALHLHDLGVPSVVLDARDRVGGRVWSVQLDTGTIAELGAEWIMSGDDTLAGLAGRFGVPAVETGTDYKLREARGPRSASIAEQEAFLRSANERRRRMSEGEVASTSLGAFLDAVPGSPAQRLTVRMRLQGTCAADLDNVALRVTDGERAFTPGGGVYHRLGPGNQALATAIAAALPDVRLRERVRSVVQGEDGVTVRTSSGEVHAAAAVVAVPSTIAAALPFEPSLPEDLAIALRELRLGPASKLAVAIAGGDAATRSLQSTELPMWCWVANGSDGRPRPCVASFAGSPLAQEALCTADGDPENWVTRLRGMNPDLELTQDVRMYAWATDPLARGAYSAWDARSWDRMPVFARPVGRVAFAGEHTAGPDHYATMEGALRSGARAAEQVVELLR